IFYFSCDELTDFKELGELLDSYLRSRESWRIKKSYIFLDEVTFVEDWWRALKSRIDGGSLLSDVLTVIGSASLDLLRQKENFPGRRGRGTDIVLRPLGFGSYVEAVSKLALQKAGSLSKVDQAMNANQIFEGRLNTLFQNYLETGGFPLAMREREEIGRVTEDSKKFLVDSLRRDWFGVGKSDKYMKEVISYIISAKGTPISWLSISKATSIASPNTARSYVETLHDLLLICELDLIEPSGKIAYRKNRKVHFADPFVYNAFSSYTSIASDQAATVEAIVASHLNRVYETFYWRNGSEVDAIAIENKEQIGFEVKWGFKKGTKPKHLKRYFSLDRRTIPLFLASLSVE
ncbi:MAG: ATP-binding protein, partial [Nitrososphaerales archaeon]